MRADGVIAHQTSTVAGVAAYPLSTVAMKKMQRFKQRKGPFLILAPHAHAALSWARYFKPAWRKLIRESWPGPVTIILPGKPGLPTACYQKGMVALRVEPIHCYHLCDRQHPLIASSSLNRKGKPLAPLHRAQRLRWSQYIDKCVTGTLGSGIASSIYRCKAQRIERLR
ncbi:MAG: Sua5/YciO/YrdC/YwlC family protein [Zetaproteobacteria bacterium]|nr:Sua5/YciO/YrdC/YwlC family protein [Zetaproteobacteria bacterium]